MKVVKGFKHLAFIWPALFICGVTAQAQVIDGTIKCSVPTCLEYADGTLWNISIEVTALGVYNGNGVSLDAYADVAANGCSVPIFGQVDGGAAVSSTSGTEIGVLAHAMGIEGTFEATFTEVNYIDGSLSITGGGSYPC
jgi:hypothetical protein